MCRASLRTLLAIWAMLVSKKEEGASLKRSRGSRGWFFGRVMRGGGKKTSGTSGSVQVWMIGEAMVVEESVDEVLLKISRGSTGLVVRRVILGGGKKTSGTSG